MKKEREKLMSKTFVQRLFDFRVLVDGIVLVDVDFDIVLIRIRTLHHQS